MMNLVRKLWKAFLKLKSDEEELMKNNYRIIDRTFDEIFDDQFLKLKFPRPYFRDRIF